MAQNDIPKSPVELSALGALMYNGLLNLGTPLGITQITPAAFQTKLTAFNNAETAFIVARTTQGSRAVALAAAEEALYKWLLKTRTVLAGRLGAAWSSAWVQAGFTSATTAVPQVSVPRAGLGTALVNYFTANPTFEVASLGITAAAASSLLYNRTTALLSLQGAEVDAKTKINARSTAETALVEMMRQLIRILDGTLAKSDPRWESFGLNLPSAKTTPGKPVNVTATVAGAQINVNCDPVPLATRYRWRIKVAGVDENFRLGKSSPTTDAILTGIAPGYSVDVMVQAVNRTLQGVPSATVRVTLPLAQSAAAPVAPLVADVPAELTNGSNGNGAIYRNGNGAHTAR